jgi:Glycosyltransferase like family
MASPCFRSRHHNQILMQENYPSAAKAYNAGIDKAENDLIAFVHQDVILCASWIADVIHAVAHLARHDPHWGVIGSGGVLQKQGRAYVYSSGIGIIGSPFDEPVRVRTLDEIVLIIRKGSGLRFDEGLPRFHMYGPDICLTAENAGRKNYAISAFCIHNAQPHLVLPKEFYECYAYVRRKWKKHLPIETTCIEITWSNRWMYKRRLEDLYFRYVRHKQYYAKRASDVGQLLKEVEMLQKKQSDTLALGSH